MRKGFTLIELLVVVGVIAVIMAMAVPNFLGARERANDTKKKTELTQLKSALRIWYNDYGLYPGGSGSTINACGTGSPPSGACATGISTGSGANTVTYMKNLPDDYNGSTSGTGWSYAQLSSGDDFCLWTALENRSDSDATRTHTKCAACRGGALSTGSTDYIVCAD